MANKRPGLMPTANLEAPIRRVLDPLLDVVSRITSSTNPDNKLPRLPENATLGDVIAFCNALADRIEKD